METLICLATALETLEDYAGALAYYRKARKLDPENEKAILGEKGILKVLPAKK